MKKCKECGKLMPLTSFPYNKIMRDNRLNICKKCKSIYNKNYREKNRNKIKINQKIWKQNNKDKNKKYSEKYRKNNKNKIKELNLKFKKTDRGRFNSYKSGSKSRGIKFYLSFSQFSKLINSSCHYCGDNKKIGIDRKDSKKPYIINNCVPSCPKCNYFKGTSDYNNFIKMCSKIGRHLNNYIN